MSLDEAILTALRQASGTGVSGADLSASLGVSRAAVWARIEELRQLGYEIEASPHTGYQLKSSPDLLHADDLRSRIGKTKVVGKRIQVFQSTSSTNDIAHQLLGGANTEGTVVFAEEQTKGRGRLGREWVSPKGKGLWFSVLLRPNIHSESAPRLTIMAAVSLAEAIREQTGCRTEIKWPNDILLNERKVAGILVELIAEPDRIRNAILGIGVDVNVRSRDFPPEIRSIATSIREELGQKVDRASLASAILRSLDRNYSNIATGEFGNIARKWEDLCTTLGKEVSISLGDRVVEGTAETIDEFGSLLVRTRFGQVERITGGDVTLRRRS